VADSIVANNKNPDSEGSLPDLKSAMNRYDQFFKMEVSIYCKFVRGVSIWFKDALRYELLRFTLDSIERDVLAVGRSWGFWPFRLLTLRTVLSYPVAFFKKCSP
jgi:hypothetical protein